MGTLAWYLREWGVLLAILMAGLITGLAAWAATSSPAGSCHLARSGASYGYPAVRCQP